MVEGLGFGDELVVRSVFGGGSLVLVRGAKNMEVVFNMPDAKESVQKH